MADIEGILGYFGISLETGFLSKEPMVKLHENFQIWNRVSETIGDLIEVGKVRSLVDQMPPFDYEAIMDSDKSALKLAHLQLSSIAAAYVWCQGDQEIPKKLPSQIGVPLCSISNSLGLQPVLCYADAVLFNTKKIQQEIEPIYGNLKMLYAKFIPEDDIEAFFMISSEMEIKFAVALPLMISTLQAVASNKRLIVASNMNEIALIIDSLTEAFAKMLKHVQPMVFFTKIRPYLAGYTGKAFQQQGGLLFDGVDNTPKALAGSSAGQSGIYIAIDAFLQVSHGPKEVLFQQSMKTYMLKEHREFLSFLANYSRKSDLRGYSKQDHRTVDSYNACIRSVVKFRSDHIRVVAQYIVNQASLSKQADGLMNEPGKTFGKFCTLDTEGTGGTELIPFLKRIRDSTARHIIE